ncbi:MAG: methyltransferase domain-containing protein [Bacteroidetes bacterium]|nr:methyltransferase domain-containing protein [Bacteroidota bacterium]
MNVSDAQYWDNRYRTRDFPWDAGAPTTPLVTYIDGLQDRNLRILIPGGGYGHELAYLWDKGFHHAFLLDFAPHTRQHIRSLYPQVPDAHILTRDFFAHTGQYDLILEQTFFCALDPARRQAYADQVYRLLVPGGCLAGVLFSFPLTTEGPPFGGDEAEYRRYFRAFPQVDISPCHNSIKPRMGNEYFIRLTR